MGNGAIDRAAPIRWWHRLRRRLRQWRGTAPRTRVQIHGERELHGGWWLCPAVMQAGDVVYSFDIGADLELERALLHEYGAQVYLFDPDPEVATRADADGLLHRIQLYAIRAGPENRPAVPDAGPRGARMIRLGDLMRNLGHRRIDLVKIHVESAAAVIRDLVDLEVDVRQLLVSFPLTRTAAEREQVEAMVRSLQKLGYRIFHIGSDGRRYSFIRTDFGAP